MLTRCLSRRRHLVFKNDFPMEVMVNYGELHNWEQTMQYHRRKRRTFFRDLHVVQHDKDKEANWIHDRHLKLKT